MDDRFRPRRDDNSISYYNPKEIPKTESNHRLYCHEGKILDWSMYTNEIQLTETKIQIINQAQYNNHSPHRWYSLEEYEHGVNQLRVTGRLQSSNRRQNKVLSAAIEVHEDYKRFRAKLEKAKGRRL
jgi:vancomycin resistance protein YoaR